MNADNFQFQNRFNVIFGNSEYNILNQSIVNITNPSISLGNIEQQTSIKPIYLPGDSIDISDINMSFILDENYNNYKLILDWLKILRNPHEIDFDRHVTDISIMFLDMRYKETLSINYEDCYPYTISELTMDNQISDIEPIVFTVSFKVNNINY